MRVYAGGGIQMGERWDEEEEQRGRGPLHILRPRRAAEKALGTYPVSTSSRVKMHKPLKDADPLSVALAHTHHTHTRMNSIIREGHVYMPTSLRVRVSVCK